MTALWCYTRRWRCCCCCWLLPSSDNSTSDMHDHRSALIGNEARPCGHCLRPVVTHRKRGGINVYGLIGHLAVWCLRARTASVTARDESGVSWRTGYLSLDGCLAGYIRQVGAVGSTVNRGGRQDVDAEWTVKSELRLGIALTFVVSVSCTASLLVAVLWLHQTWMTIINPTS